MTTAQQVSPTKLRLNISILRIMWRFDSFLGPGSKDVVATMVVYSKSISIDVNKESIEVARGARRARLSVVPARSPLIKYRARFSRSTLHSLVYPSSAYSDRPHSHAHFGDIEFPLSLRHLNRSPS